jgi:peptidoglycan/LPS O-acetylase OafA/YrhL
MCSLLIRFLLCQQGLYDDPWSYRFFPSELVFFLIGALTYRDYAVLQLKQLPRSLMQVAFGVALAYTVLYQFVPGGELVRQVGYYICFALALPLVFALTKDSR